MALVTNRMLGMIDTLPQGFNSNILKQTKEQLERFNREVIRTTPKTGTHFDKPPKDEKLRNIVTVVDLLSRVAGEETPHTYGDLVDMIVDFIDTVYYAEGNRKNLNLGKYRALMQFIIKEMRNDVDKVPSSLVYLNNKKKVAMLLDFEGDHEKIEE